MANLSLSLLSLALWVVWVMSLSNHILTSLELKTNLKLNKKKRSRECWILKTKNQLIRNISNPIGMNQLICLIIWDWRKRSSEESMVTVSLNPPQSSKEVFYQSFRVMTPSPRLNLELVRQVPLQLPHCKQSIAHLNTSKDLLLLQPESFLCRLPSS
jgi:hypothetical protein